MKRKLLLIFFTLSICNLYVSSEVNEPSETMPLLQQVVSRINFSEINWDRTQLQRAFQRVGADILQNPFPIIQGDVGFIFRTTELVPPHITLAHLETLDKAGWENWIRKYGVPTSPEYSMAIDSATEYAENHKENWEDFRKKIVEEPTLCYKLFHSRTMTNRIAFFQTVDYRMMGRQGIIELQRCIQTQNRAISMLSAKKSDLETRLEALEQRLRDESKKRESLELEINALKEQRVIEHPPVLESPPPVHTDADMTKISEDFTSQIEKLSTQFEELKSSISTGDSELASRIQMLSEKVDTMDLKGIRADIETLKTTKVGVNYINRFSYLVQALIIAKKMESMQNRYISINEWKQIVQEQKTKVEVSPK